MNTKHLAFVLSSSSFALILGSSNAIASKPSFNCNKASSWSEIQVCQSDFLATLDVELATIFKNRLAGLTEPDKNALRLSQRQWINDRNMCESSQSSSPSDCLANVYKNRISELNKQSQVPQATQTPAFSSPLAKDPVRFFDQPLKPGQPKIEAPETQGEYIFKNFTCNDSAHYGLVSMYVDDQTDLANTEIALKVLSDGANYVRKYCHSIRGYDNIALSVNFKSKLGQKLYEYNSSIWARSYGQNQLSWREYRNSEADKRQREEQARQAAARQQEQQRQQEIKTQEDARQLDVAAQEKRKRLVQFLKATGVEERAIHEAQFAVNPFPYEDKKIAIMLEFIRMISKNEALFTADDKVVIISKVPSDKFLKEKERFLVAGRAEGVKPWKTPMGGEMQVPFLIYIDAIPISVVNVAGRSGYFEDPNVFSVEDLDYAFEQAKVQTK